MVKCVLENKIPPPIIALVSAMLMWVISTFSLDVGITFMTRIVLVIMFFLLGFFFIFLGLISFRRAQTTVDPMKPEAASSLVRTGVYRFSRNPMYIGLVLLLLALLIFLTSPLSIIGIIGFVLYINEFQIKPEEQALMKKFGREYTEYQLKVRRWI